MLNVQLMYNFDVSLFVAFCVSIRLSFFISRSQLNLKIFEFYLEMSYFSDDHYFALSIILEQI